MVAAAEKETRGWMVQPRLPSPSLVAIDRLTNVTRRLKHALNLVDNSVACRSRLAVDPYATMSMAIDSHPQVQRGIPDRNIIVRACIGSQALASSSKLSVWSREPRRGGCRLGRLVTRIVCWIKQSFEKERRPGRWEKIGRSRVREQVHIGEKSKVEEVVKEHLAQVKEDVVWQ